jgi:hypothetical protein
MVRALNHWRRKARINEDGSQSLAMTAAAEPTAAKTSALPWRAAMIALAAMAAIGLCGQHLYLARALPLWFDEAWTAEVAATPNWASFHAEVMNDLQAPLYYLIMRLWAAVAGTSDLALRLPGIAFLACAAGLPMIRRVKGLDADARLTWGLMTLGWWGVGVFLLGRGYSLLLALSMLQALAFADLLAAPGRARAWRWTVVAALAVLTQYLALIAVAAQGLVFLAAHRRAAFRTWPALAAFVPVFAWMAYHGPRVADFSGMQNWHPPVTAFGAVGLTAFAANPTTPVVLLLVALTAVAVVARPGRTSDADAVPHLWLTALAALLGLGLFLLAGAIRPVLTPRYLMPVIPGLLLGLVMIARRSDRPRAALSALAALYLGVALWPGQVQATLRQGAPYGYEEASNSLMRRGVSNLVFVWDHQAARVERIASMRRLGGVFFERAGHAVAVAPLAPRESDDVSVQAIAAASGERPGIIWIYNRQSPTAARRFPPRIDQLDSRWRCEHWGDGMVGSVACWREG